jgi:hypothetical protein
VTPQPVLRGTLMGSGFARSRIGQKRVGRYQGFCPTHRQRPTERVSHIHGLRAEACIHRYPAIRVVRPKRGTSLVEETALT